MDSSQSISLFYKIIWISYLFLAPFYIFTSGYPQPADFIIVLGLIPAFGMLLLQHKIKISTPILIGLAFVSLTFAINIIHFIFTPDKKFLLSSIYYVYNFAVFLFVGYLFSKAPQTTNKLTYWALAVSIITELIFVLFFSGNEIRATGTFNNPNQLGYWSLLSIALLIVVKRDQKINALDLSLIFIVLITQILSLSKAGILSMLFCVGILFFSRLLTNKHRILIVSIALIVTIYTAFSDGGLSKRIQDLNALQALYTRISTIGTQGDDSLGGRGYDRIIKNPHLTIFGAGEGANWRYSIQNKELHSGLATLIFSYGPTGFVIFFTFLFFAFKGTPWRYKMLLVPIMMYGLTHQNIRFTYFWVFLASAYSIRYFEETTDEQLFTDNSYIGETPPRQNTA